MEEITFYWEWLSLPKDQFRLLAMIAASGGQFDGNYTDMCNYLSITAQSGNRAKIKTALEALTSAGYIGWEQSGRTHHLGIKPKETEIKIPLALANSIIRHNYSFDAKVAWEQVLKLYIWVVHNDIEIIQNHIIAGDLFISDKTITSAKKVLIEEYEAINRKMIHQKLREDMYKRIGHKLEAIAWWKDIT